jgi:hypothetical protein
MIVLMGVLRAVLLLESVFLRIVALIAFGYALALLAVFVRMKMSSVMDAITPNWPPENSKGFTSKIEVLARQASSQRRPPPPAVSSQTRGSLNTWTGNGVSGVRLSTLREFPVGRGGDDTMLTQGLTSAINVPSSITQQEREQGGDDTDWFHDPQDTANPSSRTMFCPKDPRPAYTDVDMDALTLFEELDDDHSGHLDCDELKTLVATLGWSMNSHQLSEAMAAMDKDNSGHVCFAEFAEWWESCAGKPANPNPIPTKVWCSQHSPEHTLTRHDMLFFRLPCAFWRCINREEGLEEHGPALTLQMVQALMLLNALYISILVFWVTAFDVSRGKMPGPLFGHEVTCPSEYLRYSYTTHPAEAARANASGYQSLAAGGGSCVNASDCERACDEHMDASFLNGYWLPTVCTNTAAGSFLASPCSACWFLMI